MNEIYSHSSFLNLLASLFLLLVGVLHVAAIMAKVDAGAFLAEEQVEQRADKRDQPDHEQPADHSQTAVVVLQDHHRLDDMPDERDEHDNQKQTRIESTASIS